MKREQKKRPCEENVSTEKGEGKRFWARVRKGRVLVQTPNPREGRNTGKRNLQANN